MRYKIITFRGFDFSASDMGAKRIARRMIRDIKCARFPSIHWWAKIVDTRMNRAKFIECDSDGQYHQYDWEPIEDNK